MASIDDKPKTLRELLPTLTDPKTAERIGNSRLARIGKLMREQGITYAEAAAIIDKPKH